MPIVEATPAASSGAEGAPAPAAPKTFEEVRAARHAGLAETPAAAAPPVDPAKPNVTAEIDMSPEELAAATAASKAEREQRTRIKELEGKAADGDKLAEARKLVGEGKHNAAAKLLGIDLNAAVAEELGETPAPGEEPDPKVKELEETVRRLTESDAARAKREAEELQVRTKESRAADVNVVVEHVKAEAAKYPYLSRNPDWVAEAYDGAADAYPKVVERLGRPLTGEEKTRLVEAALAEKEAEHVERAKLYGPPSVGLERRGGAAPPRPGARPSTFVASMRGGTATPVTKTKTKLSFEDAKARRRNAS